MASINGISLKGFKEVPGREGIGFIGNLYMDDKKIGEAADYADGGPIDINIYGKEELKNFTKRVTDYFNKFPEKDTIKMDLKTLLANKENLPNSNSEYTNNDESFISSLVDLTNFEKEFKKAAKKFENPVVVFFDYHMISEPLPQSWGEGFMSSLENDVEKSIKKHIEKHPNEFAKIFTDLNDFNIDSATGINALLDQDTLPKDKRKELSKITVSDEEKLNREKELFSKYAEKYGFSDADYGARFKDGANNTFEFIGFNPTKSKNCIRIRKVDTKDVYMCSREALQSFLAKAKMESAASEAKEAARGGSSKAKSNKSQDER